MNAVPLRQLAPQSHEAALGDCENHEKSMGSHQKSGHLVLGGDCACLENRGELSSMVLGISGDNRAHGPLAALGSGAGDAVVWRLCRAGAGVFEHGH